MAQLALGLVGAFLGSLIAPGIGTAIGWGLGSWLGGYLFQKPVEGPRLTDLKGQTASYGSPIPIVYGTFRLAGTLIDQTDLKEHKHTSNGKGGQRQTTYSYSCSFAILLCEGPISGVKRIWADSRLIWKDGKTLGTDTDLPFVLYLGSDTQGPDPTFEAIHGVGHVPAYQGFAYIVFTDLELSDYYNRIPLLTFEVVAVTGTQEAFGLRRYSGFALDPGAFAGSIVAYSYPYLLNGQTLPDGKTLVSQNWRAARDYGPDLADGAFSYAETRRTLKGAILSVVGTAHNPFPQYPEQTQPMGLPQIFGFQIHGSMNNTLSYMNGNVLRIWPDGTNTPHYHLVSGWFTHGDAVNVPNEALIANRYPDGDGFSMWINGSIWVTAEAVYATGGGLGGNGVDGPEGTAFIRKYPITKGKPSLTPAASFTFPGYGGINTPNPGFGYDVTVADDGFVYVLGSVNGVNEKQLFKFDKDLNLVRLWNSPDSAYYPTIPVLHLNFSPTSGGGPDVGYNSFTVYRDYIVVGGTVGTTVSAICFKLNADDTTTYVNSVPAFDPAHPTSITGPKIYLGNGFIAVRDGILNFGGAGADAGLTLADIVADVSRRCGVDATEYDVTEIPDPVHGFAVSRQMSGRAAIEAMMPAFVFAAVESDDKVKFRHLNRPSDGVIPDDDLGVHAPNAQVPPLLATHRLQEVDLPWRVWFKYLNLGSDYQDGTQLWQKQTTTSQLEANLEVAVVMTDDEAKAAVEINGMNAWMEEEEFTFFTSRKYAHVEPLDVRTVQSRTMRIVSKDESVDDVIKFSAKATVEGVFTTGTDGTPGGFVPPPENVAQKTDLVLLDTPLPTDDSNPNGYPAAMAGQDRPDWKGAQLFKSTDGGASYVDTGMIGLTPDTMGLTTTALGDFGGGNIFDELNTVTVAIGAGGGTLASATATAVLNDATANLCVIGNEFLQYKVATLIAADTYLLSGLLRGRRGTEWATSSHTAGEFFGVAPFQNNLAGPLAEVGQALSFKAVTLGNSLSKADAVPFTNLGIALRPYAPVQLGGGTNAAGDVTLNWNRRDRKAGPWRDYVDIPMSESTEAYIVQIWELSYTVCARIITVTAATTTVYTSAQQVTDFGAQQQRIYFTVGQLGSVSLGSQSRGVANGLGSVTGNPSTPIAPYAFPTTIAPIPGPTRTPDWTFTTVSGETIHPVLTVGQKWSGKFHTPGGTPRGSVSIAEYIGLPTFRHCWISSDSGGLNKMAHSEQYGQQLSALVGAVNGGAPLAASTDYYFFTDFVMADGSIIEVIGSSAPSIITIQIV